MSAQPRRVNISELGEPMRELIREVRDSGDEVVLVDGGLSIATIRPLSADDDAEVPSSQPTSDEEIVWAGIIAGRKALTAAWNSPLSGAEAIAEQRR